MIGLYNAADLVAVWYRDMKAPITITPRDQLSTSERGASSSSDVVLNSQPRGKVVLSLASSDENEARPRQAMLTFTPACRGA